MCCFDKAFAYPHLELVAGGKLIQIWHDTEGGNRKTNAGIYVDPDID